MIMLGGMGDHAGRRGYDSDITDAQWELVEPLLPPERGGRRWGHPLTHPRREIAGHDPLYRQGGVFLAGSYPVISPP